MCASGDAVAGSEADARSLLADRVDACAICEIVVRATGVRSLAGTSSLCTVPDWLGTVICDRPYRRCDPDCAMDSLSSLSGDPDRYVFLPPVLLDL